jgi:hypothetical protein
MDPTTILNRDGTNAFTVSKGSLLQPTQRATAGGKIYYQVNILDASGKATGQSGVVLSTDTTELDYGRETVDLPVPEIHTVNSATGTVLNGETRCSNTDPVLPQATRVRVLGPFGKLAAYVRVEVADGPLTGRRGVVSIIDLTRETLGTH